MTTVVTGHGRSGTHWLAHVLGRFTRAAHEPPLAPVWAVGDQGIVVDCRLWRHRSKLEADGHRLVHLVRDGRDVVRSAYSYWGGEDRQTWEATCLEWALTVGEMDGVETVRLEDLLARQASTKEHRLPHWRDWPASYTDTFWRICGNAMERHGYRR